MKLTTEPGRTTRRSEGESVRLKVKLENVSGKGQGMAVAIVGLPAGLTLPEDLKQLKDHIRLPEDGSRPLVGMFEVRGRELVLYWRDLAKGQKIEVPIDLWRAAGRIPRAGEPGVPVLSADSPAGSTHSR